MPVDRPTFHESWYRVASTRPRLRASVQSYRQHYRGRPWHVLQDPASNRFYRLSESAYHFVALLDGRRSVEQAWRACNETLGDDSPTQGEVIQTLSQLHNSNLLQADLPADAAGLFDRYRKRVNREVRSYVSNLLFVRIPLFDPNRILDRWVGAVGWVFGPVGAVLWLGLMIAAAFSLAGRWDELVSRSVSMFASENLLRADNLLLLYLCMAGIKAIHEFGHGFACKRFGRRNGSGGDVHTMGIMLLVLLPIPYVDASSAWAFRSKWQRAFVGAAGMYVELATAALAAIVWAHTAPGTVHALAYNVILIASVTTLLFNGNPLLRFDGYYILSDLLETPNLYQRSKDQLYFLIRRFVYGVRRVNEPAHTPGERAWLPVYGLASFVYRVVICVGILLFVADKAFFVGAILAAMAVVTWVVVPLGKWVRYLATNPELTRTRGRAVLATVGVLGGLLLSVSAVPVAETHRAQGVVEPRESTVIHMMQTGVLTHALPTGEQVRPDGSPLIRASNVELTAEHSETRAQLAEARAQLRKARVEDLGQYQALVRKIEALRERLDDLDRRIAQLRLTSDTPGTWIAPDVDTLVGAHVERGHRLGVVASLDRLVIRAVTDQHLGPRLAARTRAGERVEVRVAGRPEHTLAGRVERIHDAGHRQLPSRALSARAGGSMPTRPDDREGLTAMEPFFEIRVAPDDEADPSVPLHAGQRVVVRFTMEPSPLLSQWWRTARQLLQDRFQI